MRQQPLDAAAFLDARPVELANVTEGYGAVRADEEARRHCLDSPRGGRAGIAVEQQRKAQAEVLRGILCGAYAAAHLHRQDDEWPARERDTEPLDAGQLIAARLAPGGPEIEQDHLPPIIGEAVRRTVRSSARSTGTQPTSSAKNSARQCWALLMTGVDGPTLL